MKTIRPKTRRGFSLIELLVVIGIIMFLAAALAFTIPNILSTAKEASTRTTIEKVHGLLEKRMHAINRELDDQDKAAVGGKPSYLLNSPYASVVPLEKALVLARKHFVRQHLPMNFAESANQPPNIGGTHVPSTENAEILYYVLTQGPQFDAAPEATDAFRASELADTDGDGLMEIVDDWGQPLRFYRWPTRLIRPIDSEDNPNSATNSQRENASADGYVYLINPDFSGTGITARILISSVGIPAAVPTTWVDELNNQPLARDPDDPLGLMARVPPVTNPDNTETTNFETEFHTPDTWHAPLIVSAGRDGVLGLFEPSDTANHGQLAQPDLSAAGLEGLVDNITNLQE